jgi:prepilin-type N-terminal cleavage/methylation domain-containing protein
LNKRGFTLVELLVAASIFLVATLAFGSLLKIGMSSIRAARDLNRAAYTLQAKMEEIQETPFAELPGLNGSSFANGKGRISVSPVLADLVRIRLELSWDPDRTSLHIYTLRSSYQ